MGVRHAGRQVAGIFIILVLTLWSTAAYADHATPGEAGRTKVNIYDNTNDIWNVTVGVPDPVIGFVNFRPTTPGDPSQIVIVVSLKSGAPSCDYNIELVTSGTNPDAGLAPDGAHFGAVSVIGTLVTNAQGNGNTGDIVLDVSALPPFTNLAPSGQFTYAHVDLEDYNSDCTEADGTGVVSNEYGASGKQPGSPLDLPVNIHWLQP